ncbi:TetR/AcrR family transcriptional regulator [Anaerocolumna sp. AGMB13025]|uniref:TetR/AcrR family transcriptional regulator n=1 Tax=Anaerocolumna sp. AGMB13025 TaxID=3039116 RepID=UPI00241BFE6A|nr:TetR/AcrR family transcriptional regulator [Anaerocolumna sp. AGMB13025]WFR58705.1 TetR/AcrR family transcriptional regulator [Anaerocolumna sp. AGMB13025]
MITNSLSAITAQTRQNLIDAFWQLYCKKKIEKISVKEVCELAGYNRSTFYVYFKDVYEILEEIEEKTITAEEFRVIILEQLLTDSDKKETLKKVVQLFEKNIKYLPILLSENGDPFFRQKLLKKLVPTVISAFHDLTSDEMVRIKYIMEYQSAAALSTIAKWYLNGKDIPLEQFLELLYSITSNGIQKELLNYVK